MFAMLGLVMILAVIMGTRDNSVLKFAAWMFIGIMLGAVIIIGSTVLASVDMGIVPATGALSMALTPRTLRLFEAKGKGEVCLFKDMHKAVQRTGVVVDIMPEDGSGHCWLVDAKDAQGRVFKVYLNTSDTHPRTSLL